MVDGHGEIRADLAAGPCTPAVTPLHTWPDPVDRKRVRRYPPDIELFEPRIGMPRSSMGVHGSCVGSSSGVDPVRLRPRPAGGSRCARRSPLRWRAPAWPCG